MGVSTKFDPYYKWLGIAPLEQPPNHYRLLGVNPFESDFEVIESGAEQRTKYLRTFQDGPNNALSLKLLNEIAAARACLLKPDRKSEYDDRLKGPPNIYSRSMAPTLPMFPVRAIEAPPRVAQSNGLLRTLARSARETDNVNDPPGAVELESLGIFASEVRHRHPTANPPPIIPLVGPMYFIVGVLLGALLTPVAHKMIETDGRTSGAPHIVAADSSHGDRPRQQRTSEKENTRNVQQ